MLSMSLSISSLPPALLSVVSPFLSFTPFSHGHTYRASLVMATRKVFCWGWGGCSVFPRPFFSVTKKGGVAFQHPRKRHLVQPCGFRGRVGHARKRLLVYRLPQARGRRQAGRWCPVGIGLVWLVCDPDRCWLGQML